jgi:hypothetical protein
MSTRLLEGAPEEGLSGSILRLVDNPCHLERLRLMLGSFNHRCRNTLNGIKMSLYLAKRETKGAMPLDWCELERDYEEIERLFDRLQTIYKPLRLSVIRSPLGRLIEEHLPMWRSLSSAGTGSMAGAGTGKVEICLKKPEIELPCDFDPMYMGLGLDALVGWRLGHIPPANPPALSWNVTPDSCEIEWREEPNVTGGGAHSTASHHARTNRPRVDSLALPLLARVMHAHGGRQQVASEQGFAITLMWPRYQQESETASAIGI